MYYKTGLPRGSGERTGTVKLTCQGGRRCGSGPEGGYTKNAKGPEGLDSEELPSLKRSKRLPGDPTFFPTSQGRYAPPAGFTERQDHGL